VSRFIDIKSKIRSLRAKIGENEEIVDVGDRIQIVWGVSAKLKAYPNQD
jgi:DNA-binding response OmpR family regulator